MVWFVCLVAVFFFGICRNDVLELKEEERKKSRLSSLPITIAGGLRTNGPSLSQPESS
jgi:hypothetical protein